MATNISHKALARLETSKINRVATFHSPSDSIRERLEEAHALLLMLAAAHRVCDQGPEIDSDPLASLNDRIKLMAFEGIATLLALAQHHLDVAEAEGREGSGHE